MDVAHRENDLMAIALIDFTLPTLAENLALDEALLLEAEAGAGGEVLRFWEWPQPSVILGAGSELAIDANESACELDGIEIQRRSSGGGTVLLGRGCLLFSFVLRFERDPSLKDVNASYRWILSRIGQAFSTLESVKQMGISDLAVVGKKVSGNAQLRKRDHLLHHGTLLSGFDLGLTARYLRIPDKQPAYREGRTHETFMSNMNVSAAELRRLLIEEWRAETGLFLLPSERVADLVREKYGREEWVRRR